MQQDYTLTRDPIFYTAVVAFAILTTALPALLGQPRFLPFIQAISLTVFLAIPLRKGHLRHALNVMTLWLVLQFLLMLVLSWSLGGLVERAIGDGFAFRGQMASWFFSGGALPHGLLESPLGRLGEIAGIVLGSLFTAGLVGNWFLVRAVNLAGFSTGSLLTVMDTAALYPFALPIWTLLQIAGYAGAVVFFAEPLLTSTWSPAYYWTHRRRLILLSLGLIAAGMLLELALPAVWSRGA